MKNLVNEYQGELRVKSSDLWEALGYYEHRTLKRVIVDNYSAFQEFGLVHLDMQKPAKGSKGGRPDESYLLNEEQFIMLIMLAKNNPNSVGLKVRVCKEFSRMKKQLNELLMNRKNEEWLLFRKEGKIARRLETDTIKDFIEYAKSQGGSVKGCDMYYANISTMENKALFILEQKYKNLRDVLGTNELRTVQQADNIVAKALRDGMDAEMNYKDIYKMAKDNVHTFAKIRGVSALDYLNKLEEN